MGRDEPRQRDHTRQGGSISTVIDPFDSDLPGYNKPALPELGQIETEAIQRGQRIEKSLIEKGLLSLHRTPDGSIIEGKAAKAANAGKAPKAKSAKKARKKLRKLAKGITDKKRSKLMAKAAAIVDPAEREHQTLLVKSMKTKPPKESKVERQLAYQLASPDPLERDRAFAEVIAEGGR